MSQIHHRVSNFLLKPYNLYEVVLLLLIVFLKKALFNISWKFFFFLKKKNESRYTYSSKIRGLTLALTRSLLTKQSSETGLHKDSSEGDDIGIALTLNVAIDIMTIIVT
jgi:hypothetical protein